nr:YbaN family protein [Desulfitobacterium chlororespirans]
MKMIKKYVCIGLGLLCFGLGAVGVLLPLLPTTPFLLAAAFFFARGSEKFNTWFLATELYKNHLESFVSTRSMTFKTKASILAFASAMLLLAFIFTNNSLARVLIAGMFIFKYYYFTFHITTLKKDERAND